MFRRCLFVALSLVSIALPVLAQIETPAQRAFQQTMSSVRDDGNIPGLVAIAFDPDGVYLSVQGKRRFDRPDKVQGTDRFHIGSNIKSMTATLLAIAVERGRLSWETELQALFPDTPMHPAYRRVTVEQLLHHRAGIVSLPDLAALAQVPAFAGDPQQQRAAFAGWALQLPPETHIGVFNYSNGGYALAGAIVDRVSGTRFEAGLKQQLLRPIGSRAEFGWPAAQSPKQPWGHYEIDGQLIATDPADPQFLFPVWLRSAGDLSISLLDYASYVMLHVEAACGRPRLLSAQAFERMHAVPDSVDGEAYSMGWSELELEGGVQVSTHSGSAGNFYTTAAYDHQCERGIVVMVNSGSERAATAVESAVFDFMAQE